MTYVEGASLHQDRGGRDGLRPLRVQRAGDFIAGWVMVLDYVILLVGHGVHGHALPGRVLGADRPGALENVVALAILAWVAWRSIRGFARTRVQRIAALVVVDIVLQVVVARRRARGLLPAGPHHRLDPPRRDADLGQRDLRPSASRPSSSPGSSRRPACRASCGSGGRGLERLIASERRSSVLVLYVGVAWSRCRRFRSWENETLAGAQLPQRPDGRGRRGVPPRAGYSDPLKYIIAAAATATLIAAAGSAMLGLSRLSYALSTNRQIPSALGRLHPTARPRRTS